TALQAKVDEAVVLNEKDYTADSWANFAAALSDAQSVLDDEAAAQEQVNDVLAALIAAIKGLKEVKEPGVPEVILEIDPGRAKIGDEVALDGSAGPNILISIKVVDSNGKIVYFDGVKSGSDGKYSTTFIVPDDITGNLTIVAGYGENVATKILEITEEVEIWDGEGSDTDWTGDGTFNNPYIINTAAQLKGLADNVNEGTPYSGSYFKLNNDIDLGNHVWTPIGGHCPINNDGIPSGFYFGGTFDGNNHVISGINVTNPAPGTGAYGLFGYVKDGTIANLGVAGKLDMSGEDISIIGSVVGYTSGSLYNIHSSVTITGLDPECKASNAGGIAGIVENNDSESILYVQYCSNAGHVSARGRIGGIVGAIYCAKSGGVVVDQCFNSGKIESISQVASKVYTGGIVGFSEGYITNCYNQGKMDRGNGNYIAGIVSMLNGYDSIASMSNCYSTAIFENYVATHDRWLWGSADHNPEVKITNCFYVKTNEDMIQPQDDDSWGTQTYVSSVTESQLRGEGKLTESNMSGDFDGYVLEYLGELFDYASSGEYPVLKWQLVPGFIVNLGELPLPETYYTVIFEITPEDVDATIVLKDSEENVIEAEEDGTYELKIGTYIYTVSAGGYKEVTGTLEITDVAKTVEVTLEVGEDEPDENYFTVVALPDTQFYSQDYPKIFDEQTKWIANNVQSENIVFVAHLGDIVNSYNNIAQWENAYNSMGIIRETGIPYSVVPGDHDMSFGDYDLTNYDTYFSYTDFVDYDWYGGHYPENSNANSYQFFSAMGRDFIVLNLVCAPPLLEEAKDWANSVLTEYRDYKAIVVTHGYIDADGNYLEGPKVAGRSIWDNIVKYHSNIIMVLCGHHSNQYHNISQGKDYNTIHNFLTDYTHLENGGNGFLRLYRFYPNQIKLKVITYSPYIDEYDTSTYGEMELDLSIL
ncbi:MAG TPA: metallophosphoesterase, partial [Clostridia bacterium]|nr:metallophosphoesterase [Clostridia bacterium]